MKSINPYLKFKGNAEAAWAELDAMFTDRFGVQWMISYGEAAS